ncbi:hypothetical protein CHH91_04480 [Virgibacillus sp. 7505]|uniref:dUTP diphosphatase n=1 Tax=Virgibacillus sp. 7505 TaxID=2022548 RepID=UPI000BA7ADA7|nr:dUTP diphosphatase [Virgibacillus sp. 7505]PAE17268.1 hypothetical protein CHH91_04480 [Virgibacillus sp. 7505]
MNLKALFETQAKLEADILEKHPVQEGEDRLSKKILALQVELGECANEWRGFKFWSLKQNPIQSKWCERCQGSGKIYGGSLLNEKVLDCWHCDGKGSTNPLLEEYVDCLHFILSIGLELNARDIVIDGNYTEENTVKTFIKLYDDITMILTDLGTDIFRGHIRTDYEELFNTFIGLGEKHLGFTWEQIEQAYYEKNMINHQRQQSGY